MASTQTDQHRPRSPGIVYGALSTVLLIVLSVVALTATQPPPPTIAEFAPQAVDQITEAPSEQSSQFGRGGEGDCPPGAADCAAGGGAGGAGAGPTVSPDPIDVPRVRACVGDPPRQIEDPQSPPCVPYWQGDNGGDTYRGVTRSEVRVVAPSNAGDAQALAPFFNRRFEFYGRKLNVIDTQGEQGSEDADQKASAQAVDDHHKAFASLHNGSGRNLSIPYYDELARRKIVFMTHESTFSTAYMRPRAPYGWQYPMASDEMFANAGEWICKRVAHKKARWAGRAGPRDMSDDERVFGVILERASESFPLSTEPVRQELEKCGVKAVYHEMAEGNGVEFGTSIMLRFQDEGVTSIVCLCHFIGIGILGRMATNQGYFPEWLITTYILNDSNLTAKMALPSEHRVRMFGLSFTPKQVRPENLPSVWARKEVDPGYEPTVPDGLNNAYRSLLLISSAIQMAGPNLTPHTFGRALQRTVFPNPPHPIMAGKVGFGGGSHSMTIDAAEIWWSESARNPYADGAGAFCYIAGGVRHERGRWPTGEAPFFQAPCDSGL